MLGLGLPPTGSASFPHSAVGSGLLLCRRPEGAWTAARARQFITFFLTLSPFSWEGHKTSFSICGKVRSGVVPKSCVALVNEVNLMSLILFWQNTRFLFVRPKLKKAGVLMLALHHFGVLRFHSVPSIFAATAITLRQ